MKAFDKLTRRGKIKRFRPLAETALRAYGLENARLHFVRFAGNTVYRVNESDPKISNSGDQPFEPGQYLLRIHADSEQPTEAIELEMCWLEAIRKDTGLPVPEPVRNRRGQLLTRVSCPGVPEPRDSTLLRWLKGHFVSKRLRPNHFRAQGRLMAQLHNHASRWQAPSGLSKRRFDWKGLFRDNSGARIPASEAWPLLEDRFREPYEAVARKTRSLMQELGEGPDVFGLIHADCGTDANLIFHNGEARPIDFDGSGFGYYAFDLAVALEHVWQEEAYAEYRDALIDGYLECRSMPDQQLRSVEFFLCAFYVYMGLWVTAVLHTAPNPRPKQLTEWQNRGLKYIERSFS